ncbi:SGNH/GDSL hydrolase family protein [Arthrobacter sp. ISL-95]|uniref:SGNH/GDSL hydrolase family protein n=1 Tax=Arthrobacter sp. ISL-95 TaxID=2819116 RepID=UPI001BE80F3F|nr:SGNH/GDSL hydrolase family protein [Arthrobacter sp. ISL-95]MBT2585145.1 SGNH/GDSL hydrolase family protein [Arthrobacter sp. ISL-95]
MNAHYYADGSAGGGSGSFKTGLHPWSRYVALGDSFTEGLGDPEPRSPGGLRGWADRVAEELSAGHDDFAYANLAISGRLLHQILDEQVGPAVELQPDLITLNAGGNDLLFHRSDPDKLALELDTGVEKLAATGATILLFTGPDFGATPVLSLARGKVAIFNEDMRVIAARHDALIADLWALRQLTDHRMWNADRLHFSPLGQHTIAIMVLDALSVPHTLEPLAPKALPERNWREARADDMVWAREHLFPWVVRRLTQRNADDGRHPKRPEPGPVFGAGMPPGAYIAPGLGSGPYQS